jgi:Chromo (CHRromatin Organisation MOdifier) domain
VETIVSHKKVNGKNFYKIRWHHFTAKDDTWEPEENLVGSNIPQLIEKFWEEQKEKKMNKKKGKAGGVRKGQVKQREKTPEKDEEAGMDDAGEGAEIGMESWFGIKPDEASRETRRLFVADRVISQTEKVGYWARLAGT